MHRRPFISPILVDLVYQAVSGVSGVHFTQAVPCPVCSGMPVSHDIKKRRFSTVYVPNGEKHIYVFVKRFHCRDCGHLCYAKAPFYDKSRFGSPIVDLCISLSQNHTFSHAATIMNRMGIVINRGTVRKTAQTYTHHVDATDIFGLWLPDSILALSTLVTTTDSHFPLKGEDILSACKLFLE
ncbi:MAG: hypothetical protein GXY48_14055 [Methanomicrobiales archaeon]|nr:hypothetical protein [Methanomicrobiales archaeon]